jgi:PAS domain S-box-containing protein
MATILVVEDRPVDRKLLTTVLKTGGHEVVEASDGGEAFEVASRVRPHLVISDILMPSVDGYELVRRIREAPALARIPVIFYTATYHEREARSLAMRCGVATILAKPAAPSTILNAVRDALHGTIAAESPASVDRTGFEREHLQVVSSTLLSRVDELHAGEQRMAALVQVAQELTAERNPTDLLNKVCAAAREVTLAQHAILGLVSQPALDTTELYTSGIDDLTRRRLKPARLSGTALADVVERRQNIRLARPAPDQPALDGTMGGWSPLESILVVPLATQVRVLGWLALRNKLGADEFSRNDEDVAVTLATHAAFALENVRLHEHERRHLTVLEQEVDDRERVEKALREAQERTEFALIAARTGIWELDLRTGRITWSRSAAALFGLSHEQAPTTASELFALVHPDDAGMLRTTFEKAVEERGEFQLEFRVLWRDGTNHWQDSRARVLSERGEAVRVLGVGIDITERKLLEQQFRQAQKMEAIGHLAGGVAHDFNNLLTAILGNANLLQDRLKETTGAIGNELSEIIKAADRAAALTRQLLAFSRKQLLQPTTIDLNALVEDLSHMLRRLIGEHVQLTTSLTADLASIRADASQITQVVMNLVVNARDAMPSGGRLSIETRNVILDSPHPTDFAVVPPGRYVMLAVSDTGTGMSEETKRRLFEPFFTTKERGKGTGLGLATVYGIVQQSGGYVWVYSEVGHGTTFKVYLPATDGVHRRAGPAATQPPAPQPAGGARTILVVEDEDAVRQLTQIILERAGHRVLVARNAQEASAIFQRHVSEIDLLITDVVMPGASGPALLKHLSQKRPDLKVLYMSGYADDAIEVQGPLESGVAFIQKPFSSELLVRKVRDAIEP